MIPSRLKSFTRDYFTLTSRERKGAIVLAIILVFQLIAIIWMNYFRTPDISFVENYKIEISNFETKVQQYDSAQSNRYSNYDKKIFTPPIKAVLKKFNPNTIGDEEWKNLGLSEKQTHIIRNFLNKGGVFRNKESFSKIYGIPPATFQQLEPYIDIPQKNTTFSDHPTYKKYPAKEIKKIYLNSADTIQLAELPLIGPGRARMIFKYREALGGFYHQDQLLEVFTMDSATVLKIAPLIVIDAGLVRKFNINNDQLKHPYLNKQIIKIIQAYRQQHGDIKTIEQLQQISLLDHELLVKLVPYVVFE